MIMTMMSALSMMRTLDQLNELAPPKLHAGPVGAEVKLVKELRSRVGHLLHDDFSKGDIYLLRWLRARKLNVKKAEEMLITHLKWRNETNMDKLRFTEPDPGMLKKFYYKMEGYDRLGNPVFIMPFGSWNIRAYLEAGGDRTKFDLHQAQMWEKAALAVEQTELSANRRKDKTPIEYVMVNDLTGFSYGTVTSLQTMQAVFGMVNNFENNYPGIVKVVYLFNGNWLFELFLRLIRPLMAGGSIDKLKVYDTDKVKWQKVLLNAIHPSQLPKKYGGSKVDNDNY